MGLVFQLPSVQRFDASSPVPGQLYALAQATILHQQLIHTERQAAVLTCGDDKTSLACELVSTPHVSPLGSHMTQALGTVFGWLRVNKETDSSTGSQTGAVSTFHKSLRRQAVVQKVGVRWQRWRPRTPVARRFRSITSTTGGHPWSFVISVEALTG